MLSREPLRQVFGFRCQCSAQLSCRCPPLELLIDEVSACRTPRCSAFIDIFVIGLIKLLGTGGLRQGVSALFESRCSGRGSLGLGRKYLEPKLQGSKIDVVDLAVVTPVVWTGQPVGLGIEVLIPGRSR